MGWGTVTPPKQQGRVDAVVLTLIEFVCWTKLPGV